jgi:hypothetical protein
VFEDRGEIPQHIRNDKEPHMRAPYIDLVKMANSPISCGDSDILELDVHIIFSYS